ncbi:MAG: FkbM family methyltransferase [Candidatus Nanoarchaeia archaeon]
MKQIKMYLDTTFKTKVLKGSKLNFLIIKHLTLVSSFIPFLKQPTQRFLKNKKKEMIIQNKLGKFSVYPNNDTIGKSSPYFEYYLQHYIPNTKNNNTFIDIGGNIGFYSFLANENNFKEIHTFEANPDTFKILNKNINLNNLKKKIIPNNIALGSKTSELIFAKNKTHTGGSRVIQDKKHYKKQENEELISVKQITFDEYSKNNKLKVENINFIKIDVEGFEYEVLKGMKNTLKQLKPTTKIFIEIWQRNKHKEEVLKLLEENNFKIKEQKGSNYLLIKK